MSDADAWRPLAAVQTCFVVQDIDAAVKRCEQDFGWGPFLRFSAPSSGADGDEGTTHVALGNAGRTQVEFIALENVDDTQQAFGRGRWLVGGEQFCFRATPFSECGVRVALPADAARS